ncbi:DegT/DnrJ/EryC1/StrS family aminotransferase [Pseudonocardia asaccharolytica]|uniref:Aminotransferase DegT n=1 Tax=Pseudonocardia asaccharolytica DSM 44247 = NBRC 16224 TaxID=1123024 RepID=A0A511D1X3_9PSEU|nr:DegT/DnrJ/EryC1/StrS aminotransferase family protein [Pseudonocardia asaccharolytica]GEL16898.1 aminotransferase DegT [Pseudonocardia asaccharolytica DSM 44247 = NBRC 16224]
MSTVAAPPLIELGAPVLGEEEKRALAEVIDDGWLTMGERVRRFEQTFAELHGVEDAVAVSSATAALQLSLAVHGIGPGDEVLVPSLSFVATASVVVHSGAKPVFVDVVAPDRPHLCLEDARARITRRTRAVIVMHYGGYGLDMPRWRAFADRFDLLLFEDAAHAAGLTGTAGMLSDAAAFSFFTNKNMTTAEGGMLLVRDPARRARARRLRAHGMTAGTSDRDRGRAVGYDVVDCGHNYRMDELRAALGLVQLKRLRGWNDTRRELTRAYRGAMAHELPEVVVPFDEAHPTTAHILPALLPPGVDRRAVMARMRAARVQTSMHYPPIHLFDYYTRSFGTVPLPHTERFSETELTLPLHPQLSMSDVERVVRSLRDAMGAAGTAARSERE